MPQSIPPKYEPLKDENDNHNNHNNNHNSNENINESTLMLDSDNEIDHDDNLSEYSQDVDVEIHSEPTATHDKIEEKNEIITMDNSLNIVETKANAPSMITFGTGNDGVFSNIAAKPEIKRTNEANGIQSGNIQDPPAYSHVEAEPVPPYPSVAVLIANATDTSLVENRPAGSLLSFFISLCVSFSFQFIGLILCMIFCQNHAGRLGARAGFGLAMVQYGMLIRNHSVGGKQYDENGYLSNSTESNEDNTGTFISYLVVLLGWFVTFHATGEYFRVRRVERLMTVQSLSEIV